MNMDDWRTSHDRHMETGNYRLFLRDTLDKAEYPDATHMVWKFKEPYSPVVDRIKDPTFAYYIMPKELNENVPFAQLNTIGTGSRILDKNQPSIGQEYRKHPEYWGGSGFIDRWHLPQIPEYANAYAQFVAGNIIDFTPTAQDVFLMRKDAPNTVVVASELSQSTNRQKIGKISPLSQPWKDERVRLAMRIQVDYTAIAAVISDKANFEANGIPVEIGTNTGVYRNPTYFLDPDKGELGELSKNFFYDLARAKQLVSAAGYDKPIPLQYQTRSNTGSTADKQELILKYYRDSGLWDLDIKIWANNFYNDLINVGGQHDGVQQETGPAGDDIDYLMYHDFHSTQLNGAAFPDAKIDAYCAEQRKAADLDKRVAILKEAQMYLATKFFYIPASSFNTTFSFRWPWLHNTTLRPHLQWLDADMPRRNG
jgi:ABC-type transport system substrate-binding protein